MPFCVFPFSQCLNSGVSVFSVCLSVCGREESWTGERSPHSPDLNILEPLDLLVSFQP